MPGRVDFEVAEPYTSRPCQSCGAPVVWVVSDGGRRMPLDVGSASRDLFGKLRMESHFAHCPDADAWRGQTRRRVRNPD